MVWLTYRGDADKITHIVAQFLVNRAADSSDEAAACTRFLMGVLGARLPPDFGGPRVRLEPVDG